MSKEDETNVVELRPGIRQSSEYDEDQVLNATGAMVGLALAAQAYERDASKDLMSYEDASLVVHIISPLCTLLQKNPQLAIDLLWKINDIMGDNIEQVEYDEI